MELPNGIETRSTYDDGDRHTDIEHMLEMNTLDFVNHTLDNVGNRIQRVDGYMVVAMSSLGIQVPW